MKDGVERIVEVLAILLPKPRTRPLLAISFIVLLLIDVPSYPRPLHKQIDALPYLLNPHPHDIIDLLMIDLHPLCLADSLSNEEVSSTPMGLKLYPYTGVDLVVDGDAGLFIDLSCCTVLGVLILVPFAFGEAVLVFYLYDHYFSQVSVEDNRTTYWFIILQFHQQQLRVDLERGRRVLLDLKQKIISLFLPIPTGLLLEDLIHVMVERLLKMIAKSIEILQLLSR